MTDLLGMGTVRPREGVAEPFSLEKPKTLHKRRNVREIQRKSLLHDPQPC